MSLPRIVHIAESFAARLHSKIRRFRERRFGPEKRPHLTIGRAYDANWLGYECAFVLSTGRTGTQTLAELLNLSPRLDAHHEPAPRLVKASFRAFLEAEEDDWVEKWRFNVLSARDDLVLQSNKDGKIYVETANRLSHFAPAIREVFPESKFIFLHRDPYAVIRSSMNRGAYQGPNRAWNFARIHPRHDSEYFEVWDSFSPVEKEAWRWHQVNSDAVSFLNSLSSGRGLELPSVALFSGDLNVYQRLFAFFGVDPPPLRRIDSVLNKRLNAQSHYGATTFQWTEENRAKVRPIIQQTASKLGYQV